MKIYMNSCYHTKLPYNDFKALSLFDAKPLSEPMLAYGQLDDGKIKLTKFVLKFKCFSRKCVLKCVQNGGHFIWVSMC